MNRRFFFTVLSILGFVGILVLILNPPVFLSGGHSGIQITDTATVNTIEIYGRDTVSLVRLAPGQWILNGNYKVNPVCISNFLYSFMKMNVRGISYNLDMKDSISLKIRIFAGKKKHLFRYYPAGGNDLIHREGDNKIYSVEVTGASKVTLSEILSDEPDYWKDHSIMDFLPGEISMIKIEHPSAPVNDFILRMENNSPVLYEPDGKTIIPTEKLDSIKINMFTSYFINIFYDNPAHGQLTAGHYFDDTPEYIITVVPFKGDPVRMSVFPLYRDNQADIFKVGIRIDENPEMFMARYIAIDLILRKKSDFFIN